MTRPGVEGAGRCSRRASGLCVPFPERRPDSNQRARLTDVLREAAAEHHAKVAAAADPDCHICHGRGWTTSYIAPSKRAQNECPCTGYGYARGRSDSYQRTRPPA